MYFSYHPTTQPNHVLNGDGGLFYVSYNSYDSAHYGSDTTALVAGQMQRFYILNGDHRKAYAPLLAQGFPACFEYFLSKPELRNRRSEKKIDLDEALSVEAYRQFLKERGRK